MGSRLVRTLVVIGGLAVGGTRQTYAQSSSSSAQTTKKPAQSRTLTPQEKEAQKHYLIALEALKNNDLTTALQELNAAAKLAPKNALIWYNLAVVESKSGNANAALDDVQKASNFGLPNPIQHDADELEAKLTYETRQAALSSKLAEIFRPVQNSSVNSQCDELHRAQVTTTWQLSGSALVAHVAASYTFFVSANNRFGDYGSTEDFTKDDYTVNFADLDPNVEAGTRLSSQWALPGANCGLFSVYVKAKDGKFILLTRVSGRIQRMRVQGQDQPESHQEGNQRIATGDMIGVYSNLDDAKTTAQALSETIRLFQGGLSGSIEQH
jgi:hypothetical protein